MKKQFLIAAMALTTLAACQSERVNPLLAEWDTPYQTPPFDKIEVTDYAPAFDAAIAEARADIDAIVADTTAPTFANTIEALERAGDKLNRIQYIFFNILEADANDEMQQVSLEVQPKLTEYSNDVALNPELFARVKAVYDQRESLELSLEEATLLEKTYKSFARSGAALDDEKKAAYREISAELSQLTLQFGQNVLAATNAFTLNITDSAAIAELPDFVKEGLAADAKARGEEGWTVTLQAPSYGPFMTYSSNRELKEQLWRAYNSRAMVEGANDNRDIVKRIAELRLKMANLLGYETYADYVLEERMAESADNVNNFLKELLDATKKYADKDYATINAYAKSLGLQGEVMPWDFGYYSEKYKNEKYALSDEMVKPYLKLDNVKKGVFMLATKLYGLEFKENTTIPVYHPEVSAYEVYDASGKMMAILYLDFFPRATKRGGAWMTEFRPASFDAEGNEIRPLVSLVMNFTKPTETTPSLLTFDEFTTFLHEFGHALHGMLGEGKYASLTGTSVYRDFVELPSQLLENWATEKEYLDLWAVHYESGEQMPAELIAKIVDAKNYLAAYMNVRQLSFGMTDMAWHSLTEPYTGDVEAFEKASMKPTQIVPEVEDTGMATSFSHIFSGGYAAGYYGYKWAEVLDADAFSLFKEKGIFNTEVSTSFRENVLSKGGVEHPMELYVRFRGHKPDQKALIERMGLK